MKPDELPFAPAEFDAVAMAFGIRNIQDKSGALNFCDFIKTDGHAKSRHSVIPTEAGIHKFLKTLDAGVRRHDGPRRISTFCKTVKKDGCVKSRHLPFSDPGPARQGAASAERTFPAAS